MSYVKKIEIFEAGAGFYKDLVKGVNNFLAQETERGFVVLSIQYQTNTDGYSCMVYYSEPVEEKE